MTLTSKGFLNIVTQLFVDEKELPEPEEDLPDLWPTPGWLHQSGGSQVYLVSVHSAHVWSALQADDGEVCLREREERGGRGLCKFSNKWSAWVTTGSVMDYY